MKGNDIPVVMVSLAGGSGGVGSGTVVMPLAASAGVGKPLGACMPSETLCEYLAFECASCAGKAACVLAMRQPLGAAHSASTQPSRMSKLLDKVF